LEIGFGGGEHLAAPGAGQSWDRFHRLRSVRGGIASALGYIAEADLKNISPPSGGCAGPAAVLARQSLDRVFLLFPDPWPKRRHEQRRFIGKTISIAC